MSKIKFCLCMEKQSHLTDRNGTFKQSSISIYNMCICEINKYFGDWKLYPINLKIFVHTFCHFESHTEITLREKFKFNFVLENIVSKKRYLCIFSLMSCFCLSILKFMQFVEQSWHLHVIWHHNVYWVCDLWCHKWIR